MESINNGLVRASRRRGLSFVEFIGCLLALGGGIVLGAMILGIEMKSMVIGILHQTDIVDPAMLGLTFDNDEPANEDSADDTPATATDSEQSDVSQSDATPANDKIANEDHEDQAVLQTGESAPVEQTDVQLSDEERQQATHAYWALLTEGIRMEATGRFAEINSTGDWQLFDYLTHRQKNHEKAVEWLKQLDDRGVDERLVAHGRQVLTWQTAGAKLFGRAVHLLTDGPTANLTGPFAQSWQSAATQHRMEEKLVRNKHLVVAGYLDHTYESLAPFKPATTP